MFWKRHLYTVDCHRPVIVLKYRQSDPLSGTFPGWYYSFVWMMSQTPCNYLNYDMVKVKIVIFRKKTSFSFVKSKKTRSFCFSSFFPIIDSFSDTKEIVWPQFIILERKPIHIWLEGLQAWKKVQAVSLVKTNFFAFFDVFVLSIFLKWYCSN